jgi:cold shock protein
MSTGTSSVSSSTGTPSSVRYTGRVKWFNNKAGYGFVTVTDGPNTGSDIFVHHSSIKVDSEQYKYLVQGEYVEFSLTSTSNGEHEYQAGDVSGIKGGKLMCETRRDLRTARSQYRSTKVQPETADEVNTPVPPRSVAPPNKRSPRTNKKTESKTDGDWTNVEKKTTRRGKQTSRKD